MFGWTVHGVGPGDMPDHVTFYVRADDLQETLSRAVELGGAVSAEARLHTDDETRLIGRGSARRNRPTRRCLRPEKIAAQERKRPGFRAISFLGGDHGPTEPGGER